MIKMKCRFQRCYFLNHFLRYSGVDLVLMDDLWETIVPALPSVTSHQEGGVTKGEVFTPQKSVGTACKDSPSPAQGASF